MYRGSPPSPDNPVIALYLGILAGICFYAAVHHLQVALHLRRRAQHLVISLTGVAFGIAALRSIHVWFPMETDVLMELLGQTFSLVLAGLGGLYWFVGDRAGLSRRALMLGSGSFLVAALANAAVPGTLLFERIEEVRPYATPWGVYEHPVVQRDPWGIAFLALILVVPAAVLAQGVVRGKRQMTVPEGGLLLAIVLVSVLPPLFSTAVFPFGTVPFPLAVTGFTASLLMVSVVTSRDVAQTAFLEEGVSKSEDRFRGLVDTAPQAIALFDAKDLRCVGANARVEDLLGHAAPELRAIPLDDFLGIVPEDRGRRGDLREMMERALAGEAPTKELELPRADGTLMPCEARLTALESEREPLLCVSLLDLTERREAERHRRRVEERLRQSERLEVLGTLAGSIAHDFNNLLLPILAYGEMALDDLEDHPAREYVMRMHAAAERASTLNRHILTFSRKVESSAEVLLLQSVVEESLGFLRSTIPSSVDVSYDLAAPDARIRGTAGEVHQVLMSLGFNAVEAMEGRGRVHVGLRRKDDEVALVVADAGPGIDPEVLPRIFDPFFTTRAARSSSGLGLSVVHGIVTGAGGVIDVDADETLGGARFTLRFPLVRDPG